MRGLHGPVWSLRRRIVGQTCDSESVARRSVIGHGDSRYSSDSFRVGGHRGRQDGEPLVSWSVDVRDLVCGGHFPWCTHLSQLPPRHDYWTSGFEPLGVGLCFPSYPFFQFFLAFVAMELWTSSTTGSAASFRCFAQGRTGLVQLHQCSGSDCAGAWDVRSGLRSVRSV